MNNSSIKIIIAVVAFIANIIIVMNRENRIESKIQESRVLFDHESDEGQQKMFDYIEKIYEPTWLERKAYWPIGNIGIVEGLGELPMWARLGQALLWAIIGFFLSGFIFKKSDSDDKQPVNTIYTTEELTEGSREAILKDMALKYDAKSGIYIHGSIPPKIIDNAKRTFPIPEDDKIIVFIDLTAFENSKKGLALCEKRIYCKNI